MTGCYKAEMSSDKESVFVQGTWKIEIKRENCENLTDVQCKALVTYCEEHFPLKFRDDNVNDPIVITPSEIYRTERLLGHPKTGEVYYDAETGALYSQNDILNGKYELRIRATEDPEDQSQPEK